MRFAQVMEDLTTEVPGGDQVLFINPKEAVIIGEALALLAWQNKRRRSIRALSKWFNENISIGA